MAITVDTEPSVAGAFADPARYKPLLHEPVWGAVNGRSEALGFVVDTLLAHGLTASFFVETVHLSCFPEDAMGGYVRWLREKGQDIQLHLHPVWSRFEGARYASVNDRCRELPEDRLVELIAAGSERIEKWCGRPPLCLRTGNFSVSTSVYRAMRRAGLKLGSNVCLAVAPPKEAALRFSGGVHRVAGVTELAVTCFRDRGPVGRGRYRPLQVSACSFDELRDLLISVNRAGGTVAVVVTHPFEFVKWSGPDFSRLRANTVVQRRFAQLCHFLTQAADRFEVVPMGRIAEAGIEPEEAVSLHGRALSSTLRAVENFVNDRFPPLTWMG
ncbi:hypothetical protein [Pelagibius marinus]|uniref:hypothetical protein n=1 Tax=Pelagibius marinus TaxID=2762760 RepID=UPI0018732CEC|nr:hypothetical protein [Pelagibius marinus]